MIIKVRSRKSWLIFDVMHTFMVTNSNSFKILLNVFIHMHINTLVATNHLSIDPFQSTALHFISYRNQLFDLHFKPNDWFLYDEMRHWA